MTPRADPKPIRLDLKRPSVTIVSGMSSRNKTVEIVGLTLDEAERRLTNAQEGAS
ncbi:MAG: DUF167 domain-containing protein [Thermoleophilia bacterium]|nr:DUF167 domain-containing protein [Thermoleophilia bacterium]